MPLAQLYLTLNASNELVLEGDLLGNGRETLIEDKEGPVKWDWDPAVELPERVFTLTHQAFINEMQAFLNNGSQTDFLRAMAIEHAVSHQRIQDDR